MKNIIFPLLLIVLLNNTIFAQQDPDLEKYLRRRAGVKYPNVIKINTVAIAFNNGSLIYERALAPRVSVNIGAGYKYAGELPKMLASEDNKVQLHLNKITGFSVTPELRYYLKACDSRLLDGFYMGLYFRHTNYSTSAEFDYFPENDVMQQFSANATLTEYGGGITLGYQILIWERLAIDFLFFGPRYSVNHIGYQFDSNVSEEFLNDLSGYVNEVIDRFGFEYTVDLKQVGENQASTSFGFTNMRFGISVGFAF